ncbi:hypothetical protein IVB33_32980 [Bradyrhizobium sp. 24]|uniref:hypothetical protein n=2 Tax=unclassified Bradyrhizobium TaxID=2631580 RepID=UPI001FF9C7D1|nr:hypothetical protein [Bradyrhizobium sp. 37]MCK1381547.1 hypothetical protein [Bradyrhizobium sp. 24]
MDVELVEAAVRMRRIEVDQHRYELKALIDSEKPSKGASEETVKFVSNNDKAASMLQVVASRLIVVG